MSGSCRESVSAATHPEAAAPYARLRPHAPRPPSQDRRYPGRLPSQTTQHSQPSTRRGRGRTRPPRKPANPYLTNVSVWTRTPAMVVPMAASLCGRASRHTGTGWLLCARSNSGRAGPAPYRVRNRPSWCPKPPKGGAESPQITRWNGLERALQRAVRRAKAPILYTKRLQIPRMGGSGVKVEDFDTSSCLRHDPGFVGDPARGHLLPGAVHRLRRLAVNGERALAGGFRFTLASGDLFL